MMYNGNPIGKLLEFNGEIVGFVYAAQPIEREWFEPKKVILTFLPFVMTPYTWCLEWYIHDDIVRAKLVTLIEPIFKPNV